MLRGVDMKRIGLAIGVLSCVTLSVAAVPQAAPAHIVVSPLCYRTVAWNQEGALNAYVHLGMNYPCGCDMLAWGQIVTYHGLVTKFPATDWKPKPTEGKVYLYDYGNNFIGAETRTTLPGEYPWEDICKQGAGVSRLMRDLGTLGNTVYRPTGTAGTLGNTGVAKYFGYKGVGYKMTLNYSEGKLAQADFQQMIVASIRASLQAGAPVAVAINLANRKGPHAIVCDGFGFAEDGTEVYHFHYGWGSESGRWYKASFFSEFGDESADQFLAAYFNTHPQDLKGVLAGRVVRDGKPMADVTVQLSDEQSVQTDAAGAYVFTGLSMDSTYTVSVTVGNESATQTFTTEKEFVDDDLRVIRQTEWEDLNGKDGTYIPLTTGNVIADFAFAAPKLYVTATGKGNGQSWESAAPLTNDVLKDIPAGTEVHVASGDYLAVDVLSVPDGVKLMGGFNPTTGARNVYGTPTTLSLKEDTNNAYLFDLNATAVVDGFVLENNNTRSQSTIRGGTVKNCIFTGNVEHFATGATLQCCIMRNKSATQATCSLIHCTFYGEIPAGKEGGGTVAGCLGWVKSDVPDASNIGGCKCGYCPEEGLNGRALENTPGAMSTLAPGYLLYLK